MDCLLYTSTGALGETPAKAVEVDIVISAAEEAEEEAAEEMCIRDRGIIRH